MLKSIFRSKTKSSKAGLTTPSTNDTKNRTHLNPKHGGAGAESASVVQLNNEIGPHSERAIDVLPEKHTNFFLSSSSDLNSASSARRIHSMSADNLVINGRIALRQKEIDKENVNHLQNEERNKVSSSQQEHCSEQHHLDTLASPRLQWQTGSGVRTEVVKQFNGGPDILLIEDAEDLGYQCPSQLTTAGCSGKVQSSQNFRTVSPSQPADPKHITLVNSSVQQSGSNVFICDANNTSFLEDVIPQLVPISLNNTTEIQHMDKEPVGSQVIETACSRINCRQDASGNIGNESEMYILTDSFLDYSSASFMNAVNRTSCSDVIVSDDYSSNFLVQQQRLHGLNAALLSSHVTNSLPWTCCDENVLERVRPDSEIPQEEIKIASQVAGPKTVTWQQKPVQEWSSEEVLMWVEDMGLNDYYETFKSNAIVGQDLSVISIKLLDRLEVFGQSERERVLRCLYLLHSSGFSARQTNTSTVLPSFQLPNDQSTRITDSALSSFQTSQIECGSQYSTGVVKQLSFDERSLTASTKDTGSSFCRSSSLSVSNNSSNTTASSIRQLTTSSSLREMTSEEITDKVSNETLESETSHFNEKQPAEQPQVQVRNGKSDCETRLDLAEPERKSQSLHQVLSTNFTVPAATIAAVNLTMTKNSSFGFMLGLDASQRPIIKHVEPGVPLKKSDRLLEINGHYVLNLSEQQLYKLLSSVGDSLTVVVLRSQDSAQLHPSEEFDALKEDLQIALLEWEAAQQEIKDLTDELNRLRENNEEVKESDVDSESESTFDDISALDD